MIMGFTLRPSCIGITGLYYREPLFTHRAPKSRCSGRVTSGNRGKGQENQNRRGQEEISEAVQSGRFGARRRSLQARPVGQRSGSITYHFSGGSP
jgi:hypothetical protein